MRVVTEIPGSAIAAAATDTPRGAVAPWGKDRIRPSRGDVRGSEGGEGESRPGAVPAAPAACHASIAPRGRACGARVNASVYETYIIYANLYSRSSVREFRFGGSAADRATASVARALVWKAKQTQARSPICRVSGVGYQSAILSDPRTAAQSPPNQRYNGESRDQDTFMVIAREKFAGPSPGGMATTLGN